MIVGLDRGGEDVVKFKTLSGKEALTLLLYLPGKTGQVGEPIVGRTRIVKMMFLFSKEVQPQLRKKGIEFSLPQFDAYDYGPFSSDVFDDLETLRTLQILSVETVPASEPFDVLDDFSEQDYRFGSAGEVERQFMDKYSLTPDRGIGFCESVLVRRFTAEQMDFLKAFKTRCNGVSLTALLRYVYTRYPKYTENSKIRERVLKYETLVSSDFGSGAGDL